MDVFTKIWTTFKKKGIGLLLEQPFHHESMKSIVSASQRDSPGVEGEAFLTHGNTHMNENTLHELNANLARSDISPGPGVIHA